MKKIFVAAAIIAMFAAVSCKNDKKADEKPAEEAKVECTKDCEKQCCKDESVAGQLQEKAEGAAVQVGSAAIDAAADKVLEKL